MRQPKDAAQQADAGVSASVEIWQLKQVENLEQIRVFFRESIENHILGNFCVVNHTWIKCELSHECFHKMKRKKIWHLIKTKHKTTRTREWFFTNHQQE